MMQIGSDMKVLRSTVLLEGCAQGQVLKLTADISFWGGVDPLTGTIIDERHPQFGDSVAGKILAMRRSIGSSSGSSILLELFRRNRAPLGVIIVEPDFVVSLGIVVAREMKLGNIPLVCIQDADFSSIPNSVSISLSGEIRPWAIANA
jgi:predicted aconitase with swiveling domain